MSTPTPTPTPPTNDKFSFERMVNKFRYLHLALAEAIDVWRVVPRMFIALYGAMLWWLVKWFTSSTTIEKVTCDRELVISLIQQHIDMEWVQKFACTVTDVIVVAPPTAVHATFASVLAGLSTAVFALYTTAGHDWNKGVAWWKLGRSKPTDVVVAPPLTPILDDVELAAVLPPDPTEQNPK